MKIINLIFSMSAALVLVGCATSYHPMGYAGGYDETQLALDCFRVVFDGNGYTSNDRANDFALLRSAELTLQHDYTCFGIVGEFGTISTNHPSKTIALFYQPRQELMIRCFRSMPDGIYAYDAEILQQSLKRKYDIK